jgi:hypothetical protein
MLEKLRQWCLRSHEVTLYEAIDLFKADPLAWFTYRKGEYPWPEKSNTRNRPEVLQNVCISVHGHHIADMEKLSYQGTSARIEHIGLAAELTQRGIGPLLVKALARELARRYGVNRIVFAEYSSKYHEKGYEGFFAKIGARPLPVDRHLLKPDRPDYEWLEENWE